ncbi:MAG: DHA2 family efflux MFS transporter permease subunit [Bacteroidetes bacterium]|jgi:DHA2 family multidrug resistance protein|nr:DHA2 family efflux MFS transporter permease subunit [Bacteroidota bacterium]MBP7256226.1 DHA2 family efflux MFS transporter permease subunit [Chitinophagales bacterium]MBK8671448.1 DHA2 family efflux MFS transporter permease subunit [Bacteroidota bacterium]MBK9353022.1 DHA2 family efflux MFS transporter permease subunit [Bacteroidota bacterium]MBK9633124.1 DHA2 family efflux MFS transporter permease subunit [Bacteroidota bacterium]
MAEKGSTKWIIVFTVVMCSLLELIDTSIVNVAILQLMGNLGATLGEVSWVIAAYAIANVIVVPMTSWLSNQFGRRNYFAFSVMLFTIASFLCGHSSSIWELVAFRFLQGIGGGALLATAQAILFDTFPKEEHGMASAVYGMGVVMGPTLGPTIGGYLIDNYDWPWIFYVNVPIGILAFILTLKYIKNSVHEVGSKLSASQVDWLGIALLIVGVGSLQLILEQGNEKGWFESPFIVILSFVAVLGIILFIWRELTYQYPIVKISILKNFNLGFGSLLSFVLGFGLYASVFCYPLFLQQMLGFTATQTGLSLIPGALATVFFMPFIGRSLGKGFSPKILMITGFLIFILFCSLLSFAMNPDSSSDTFYWPLILRGAALAFLFVPLTTMALSTLSPSEIPFGSGITAMMRQLGGSFGVAVVSLSIERLSMAHRVSLLPNISVFDPETNERIQIMTQGFIQKGASLDVARQQALKILDLQLSKQAAILSFHDIFMYMAIFFALCVPLSLFLRVKKGVTIDAGSAAH